MSEYYFTDEWGEIQKIEYKDNKISNEKALEIFIKNLRLKENPKFQKDENTDASYVIEMDRTKIAKRASEARRNKNYRGINRDRH